MCYIHDNGGEIMKADYINLTLDNLDSEHSCCAIADRKHQRGADAKRAWLGQGIDLLDTASQTRDGRGNPACAPLRR
jgi:hypothetical protein